MSSIMIKGVIRAGQVVVDRAIDLPDGSEVTIVARSESPETSELREAIAQLEPIRFMTEEEQSDDPDAIQQWIDELRAIPPLPEDPEDEAKRLAWEAKMRDYNIEAMRKQFEEGTP